MSGFENATPRPWYILGEDQGGDEVPYYEIAKGECGDRSFLSIAHVRAGDLHALYRVDRANAELIVTAVNAYEALVEALEMMRDADEDCKRDGLTTMPPMARAKIDAALAKARGEQ
jgi:hypothetical protein